MYLEGLWSCRYDLWDGKYLVHHRHHGGEVLGPLVHHPGEESQVRKGSNKEFYPSLEARRERKQCNGGLLDSLVNLLDFFFLIRVPFILIIIIMN